MTAQTTNAFPHDEQDMERPVGRAVHADHDATGAILLLVWLLVVIRVLPAAWGTSEPVPAPIVDTVNPNTAPWTELTVLPGIGRARARAIVAHREAGTAVKGEQSAFPVFRVPTDLEAIRGIGPKTSARMAPFLRCSDGH